jgi:putative resolvase
MKVSISKAAELLGVSITTLRRWDEEGKFRAERTPAGHRRYDVFKLQQLLQGRDAAARPERYTLLYARVSSAAQQPQMEAQVGLLMAYCAERGWSAEVETDIGGGANGRLPGLRALIQRICRGEVLRLVALSQDRLPWPGADLVFTLCAEFGTEVVLTHQQVEGLAPDVELARDVEEILAAVRARLAGSPNGQVAAALRAAAQSLA